jgi:hypothetical protein
MKCEVCGAFFSPELTFADWFDPPRFCPKCEREYVPVYVHEAFPYSGGLADYVAVFPQSNPDPVREDALYQWMEKCFKIAVYKQSAYGIVIFVGDKEFACADQWLFMFRDSPRCLLLSLFWYDFSEWEDCV